MSDSFDVRGKDNGREQSGAGFAGDFDFVARRQGDAAAILPVDRDTSSLILDEEGIFPSGEGGDLASEKYWAGDLCLIGGQVPDFANRRERRPTWLSVQGRREASGHQPGEERPRICTSTPSSQPTQHNGYF